MVPSFGLGLKKKKVYQAEAGEIFEVSGASGSIVQGTAGSDIIFATDASNVAVRSGNGDDVVQLVDFAGSVLAGGGNDYVDAFRFAGTIGTGAGSDVIGVTDGVGLSILAGSGDDAVSVNGGAGRISAGGGADIVQVANVTGKLTIDLGADRDADILIIDATVEEYGRITIRNARAEDTVIWNNLDEIA